MTPTGTCMKDHIRGNYPTPVDHRNYWSGTQRRRNSNNTSGIKILVVKKRLPKTAVKGVFTPSTVDNAGRTGGIRVSTRTMDLPFCSSRFHSNILCLLIQGEVCWWCLCSCVLPVAIPATVWCWCCSDVIGSRRGFRDGKRWFPHSEEVFLDPWEKSVQRESRRRPSRLMV